ncbi:hypothetical protein [Aeoliella sp. SH292]|jgi:hypothetical protein|uniref:hypothetical protein n=1 Tax=Aeoliella sp. SH292 TaxID=3454464 RepID=UPI003F965669
MDENPEIQSGPRFGIGLLIMITTLFAVAAAAVGGLWRGGEDRPFFVLFTLIAPGLTLILISLWQQLTRRR